MPNTWNDSGERLAHETGTQAIGSAPQNATQAHSDQPHGTGEDSESEAMSEAQRAWYSELGRIRVAYTLGEYAPLGGSGRQQTRQVVDLASLLRDAEEEPANSPAPPLSAHVNQVNDALARQYDRIKIILAQCLGDQKYRAASRADSAIRQAELELVEYLAIRIASELYDYWPEKSDPEKFLLDIGY